MFFFRNIPSLYQINSHFITPKVQIEIKQNEDFQYK